MTTHPVLSPAPTARIAVIGLGGTIAMQQDQAGGRAVPALTTVPGTAPSGALSPLPGIILEHSQVANVGSPSLEIAHVREALTRAEAAVDAGARGAVITHGTDTLEETAFLLNRYWRRDAPLVLTGAMRPANAPGADGPANLHDAIRTAASTQARGLGVLAVFDSLVHGADRVTKVSSRSVDAFDSEPSGPLAVVGPDGIRLVYSLPPTAARLTGPLPTRLPVVPVIGVGLCDRGEALAALLAAGAAGGASGAGVAGVVINGVGMGHVPERIVPLVREATDQGVPVVVSTRIPEGGTSTYHYSYPGSEVDLINNGALMAGSLSAHKARLLLQALLAAGAPRDRIEDAFAAFAY